MIHFVPKPGASAGLTGSPAEKEMRCLEKTSMPFGHVLFDVADYREELLSIYRSICGRDNPAEIEKSIDHLVNPLGNALNVAASRIKIAAGFDAGHAAAFEGDDGYVVVLIGKVFLRFADTGKGLVVNGGHGAAFVENNNAADVHNAGIDWFSPAKI